MVSFVNITLVFYLPDGYQLICICFHVNYAKFKKSISLQKVLFNGITKPSYAVLAYEADLVASKFPVYGLILSIYCNSLDVHSDFSLTLNINLTVQFLLTTGNLIDGDFVCMYVISVFRNQPIDRILEWRVGSQFLIPVVLELRQIRW